MRIFIGDLRYACRVLWRAPSFSLAVMAVLALGIGAITATFSIVNGVLLRPLPFADSDRLVRLYHVPPQNAFPGLRRFAVSPANFFDWKSSAQLFEHMAIYRFRQFALTGTGNAEAVTAGAVGADFFEAVGTTPELGRVFRSDEAVPGRAQVVILSDGFWKSHFDAARDVVNRTLTLDGQSYTIVGVMPPKFSVASWAVTAQKIWVPLAFTDTERAVRDNHNESVIARLKAGVDVSRAEAEMDVISTRLEHEYPQANAGWGATVVPLREVITGDIRQTLVMLLVAVALLLLIACANVGNLLFARGLGRRKELAIRSAFGAGRRRVFRQLLTEALVLAGAGGVAGLLIARLGLQASAGLLADQIPRADEISVDARVLFFVAGTSILTGLLAGALPAIRAGRADLNDALKEGGRNAGTVGVTTRRILIVCEVALSLVLLMAAGVMLRSLAALRHVDTGYNPHDVLTLRVSLPEARYTTPAQRTTFFDTALQRVRALPGVRAAAIIDDLPAQGGSVQPMVPEGRAELLPRDQPTVAVRKITPGYLAVLQIPLLRGRDVAEADVNVMLVSRAAARLFWGDADSLGKRATLPLESKTRSIQVVGMVGDVKRGELSEPTMPTVYQYARERPWSSAAFAIRTSVPAATLAQASTGVIRTIDPQQPIEDVRTMEELLDQTLTSQRFSAFVLGLFATVALVLASVGIYSVLSYIVRGRSQEIGIRTALGARTAVVVRLVLIEGMTPAVTGGAAGAAASLAVSKLLQKLVFDISPSDPMTLIAVSILLLLVSLVASLVPAYRAARLDLVEVLRTP